MTLANWKKMPRALFAKAWVVTGHITKEKIVEVSGITEEEWSNCNLNGHLCDLADHLGEEAAEEPSVQELVQNGQLKRKRVIWFISPKDLADAAAILPACLQFPLEKRLSNYLYCKATSTTTLKPLSTVVISRRAKEISADLLKKHFTSNDDGTKTLKPTAPPRSVKEQGALIFTAVWFVHEILYCT